MSEIDFYDPKYYTNRELSWILFNRRVLNEARDKNNPLFERLKFLSITASNLDEFFMIRVASLKDMVNARYQKPDIAGLTPAEQLERLDVAIHELVELQYSTYNRALVPKLKLNGLKIISRHEELSKKDEAFVDKYFECVSCADAHGGGLLQTLSAGAEQDPEHRRAGAEEEREGRAGVRHGAGAGSPQPHCGAAFRRRGKEDHFP